MNPVLSQMLATGSVRTADGSTIPLNSEVSAEEGLALQELIRLHKPRVTLEVGLAYGVSALFICEALAEVGGEKHIVIDPYQRGVRSMDFVAGPSHAMRVGFDGLGLANLDRAGYARLVEFHDEPSYRALPALEAAGQRIDFAFIDGWHTFDYVMLDFFYVDRMLRAGGIVVLDDTGYPAIRKLARYIATHRSYAVVGGGAGRPPSMKRRLFNALTAALRVPLLSGVSRRLIRAEVLEPDASLGVPSGNFIAFRKTAEDVLGDGSGGSRRWDQHHDF
jgi:predicted O-methyltransferase YrrM